MICEYCGSSFDTQEAEDYFEDECYILSYCNFRKRLCGKCAVDAIEDMQEGMYYEQCERCGKTFDLMGNEYFSKDGSTIDGSTIRDYWDDQILCYECVLDDINSNTVYDEEDDDCEGISVYEAADIWASNGKDEDYMFGYSEEELEDAL